MKLTERYGCWALVAGASEGLGAAYAVALAKEGFNLVLIARGEEKLSQLSHQLIQDYHIEVQYHALDLSAPDALDRIVQHLGSVEIHLLVYNAATPFIGPFLDSSAERDRIMTTVNMETPLRLVRYFGNKMVAAHKGAVVLMSSLAGFQGSGFLSLYAATKAFNRVLAEGLWYEWKEKGVDVIACCAGATATPNYLQSLPEKISFFAPRVQTPEEVVEDCFRQLGKNPSLITGTGNRVASFFMHRLFSRKLAVSIMGDTTRKMYRIKD